MDKAEEGPVTDFEAARVTVRLGAITANLKTTQRLSSPAAVGAVVKADAYGTGMAPVVRSLLGAGCDTFFVARLEEGVALRPPAPRARIFVLDGAQPDMVSALIVNNLVPVLNSLADIAAWSAAARETGAPLDAAIHIDTGMNRLGLPMAELAILAAEHTKRLAGLRVVLWVSHLACSDDPASRLNRVQLDRFKTALAMLPPAPASLASSGGIMLGKDYLFDMVRPGLALYGGNPQPGGTNPFRAAVRVTARILQLRRADKNETVGYGATYTTKRRSLLATAGLGYADGIMRALSNSGAVAIKGARAPVAGRVSMDLVTFDVTDVPGTLAVGDEVELIGDTITLEEIAAAANTISYEILTLLSHRASRRYEGVP